jgi:hypothetical protein
VISGKIHAERADARQDRKRKSRVPDPVMQFDVGFPFDLAARKGRSTSSDLGKVWVVARAPT